MTEAERVYIYEVAERMDVQRTAFIREAVLILAEACQAKGQWKTVKIGDYEVRLRASRVVKPDETTPLGYNNKAVVPQSDTDVGEVSRPIGIVEETVPAVEVVEDQSKEVGEEHEENGSQIPHEIPTITDTLRTRADARTSKSKKEKGNRGSLRSPQLASLAVRERARGNFQSEGLSNDEGETDPEVADLWKPPKPVKAYIKLQDGKRVDNVWLFANGCRIASVDVFRLLDTPFLKPLRQGMLRCFAQSLRDNYKLKWAAAMNKRTNHWRDTYQSTQAFLRAAEFAAREYARRGMSTSQFVDACNEMRPKTLKFITADLMGSAIAPRVENWLPEEQRPARKAWDTHEDSSGQVWITPSPQEQPAPLLLTAADRERFLKAHKIR
jgi:hypothetical protein